MSIVKYSALELFNWLKDGEDIAVLDVRSSEDFARQKVEAPRPFLQENISYYDFLEIEEACVRRVREFAGNRPIRILCVLGRAAIYVSEILEKNGFTDIGYLDGGINAWGTFLIPVLLNPGKEYELYQFIRPGKASCSYALVKDGEMQLFDPSHNTKFYLDFAAEKNVKISRTFETHLQADYIAGSRALMEQAGAEFLANEADFAEAQFQYTPLKNGADYGPADLPVEIHFTPGHTPGSTSYLVDNQWLISGDTVFIQSVGRPDLGGEVETWSDMLFDTLARVRKMAGNVNILPSHFMSWEEATSVNGDFAFVAPFSQVLEFNRAIYSIDNKKEFLAFIKANMRQQPEEYATIRQINAGLKSVSPEEEEILDLGKNQCAASTNAAQKTTGKN